MALVAAAGAIAYLPLYLEAHKDRLATGASHVLGRSVQIEGAVGLSWFPRPSLRLDEVEIAGAEGSAVPLPWRAGRIEADLDLAALFGRQIRIRRLYVHDAILHFDPARLSDPGTNRPSRGPGRFQFSIDTFVLSESTLVIGLAEGDARTVGISRAELTGLGSPGLELHAIGSASGTPLALAVSTGPRSGIESSRWPFKARMRLADADLEVSGTTAAPFDVAHIDGDFALSVPDATVLKRLAPMVPLSAGMFRATGRLIQDADGLTLTRIQGSLDTLELLGRIAVSDGTIHYVARALTASFDGRSGQTPITIALELSEQAGRVEDTDNPLPEWPGRLDISATIGETRVVGDLALVSGGPGLGVEGSLSIENIDLRALGGLDGPAARPDRTRVWLDAPIPVEWMRARDVNLGLRIEGVDAERLSARVTLDDGLMRVDALDVTVPGMTFAGEATLDVRPDRPAWSADVGSKRIVLPEVFAGRASASRTKGHLDGVSLIAKAKGTTARELIASLGADLMVDEARFGSATAGKGGAGEIKLTRPRLNVAPDAPVRMQAGVVAAGQAFDLDLTGGRLADLLSGGMRWPKIGVGARPDSAADAPEIRGSVGPLDALLSGRDLDLDLSTQHAGFRIVAKGKLARLDAFRDSTLNIQAAIEDLAVFGQLLAGGSFGWLSERLPDGVSGRLAAGLPRGTPLKVSASLKGIDRGLAVSDLKASSADSDLAGDLLIRLGRRPAVEARLISNRLDLTSYLRTEKPVADDAGATPLRSPLPEIPENLDGTLRLKVGHLRVGDLGLDMVDLEAALDSGALRASLAGGAERLGVEIDIEPDRAGSAYEQVGWRFDIRTRADLDSRSLLELKDTKVQSPVRARLEGRLTGVATAFEDLLGHADGHLELSLGSGQLNKRAADFLPLGGLLVGVLETINPLNRRAPTIALRCAVLQFDVADGIAVSRRGLAVQTEEINAIGGGALNLRTGDIEIRFKTTQRRGVGISLVGIADRFVYVRGTLTNPQAGIDPLGLLTQGGAAWATSGISVLADQLLRRLTGAANPCDAVRNPR